MTSTVFPTLYYNGDIICVNEQGEADYISGHSTPFELTFRLDGTNSTQGYLEIKRPPVTHYVHQKVKSSVQYDDLIADEVEYNQFRDQETTEVTKVSRIAIQLPFAMKNFLILQAIYKKAKAGRNYSLSNNGPAYRTECLDLSEAGIERLQEKLQRKLYKAAKEKIMFASRIVERKPFKPEVISGHMAAGTLSYE